MVFLNDSITVRIIPPTIQGILEDKNVKQVKISLTPTNGRYVTFSIGEKSYGVHFPFIYGIDITAAEMSSEILAHAI